MALDPHRVKELFSAALELPDAGGRQAFLDRECGADAELRLRLEVLLAAHDSPNAAVNQPLVATAAEVTVASESSETVGTVIAGKYKLLQEIGEGGMGSVFMADQLHPVKRRVAVKVIKAGMDSARVLARFEAERQALALMDHPNIAKVLDAGSTETGRPYFVMELVKGIPLTQFCDEHKLPVNDRLDLFIQVCSAVQHAHQKGIIHRDLKPTNILVENHDGKPVPKAIDFGLAKATSGMQLTEQTLFTAIGTVAGTPLYMAPEQAAFNAVDVDTRADVYALGVILYELLTGTTPIERETFKKAAFDEVLRVIREHEPPTPSSRISSSESRASVAALRQMEPIKLGRFIRGELDWIVMKSLSKERDQRYESAMAFAKDLERFLHHEPVQAGPPSAAYRLRKFVRRNRPQVIAVGLVSLVLVAGMIGTTIGLIRAEQQRQIAVEKQTEAENEKAKAVTATATAIQERQKAEKAEAETLADFRASTDDAIEQLIASKPELGPQEKAYLERTIKRWQAFADRTGNDERSQAIRGEGHARIAGLWYGLGRIDQARPEYVRARDIQQKLAEQFPAVALYRQRLAATHLHFGILLRDIGKHNDGLLEYQQARDIQQKLVDQFPSVAEYQQGLATIHNNLGILFASLLKRDEARREYEQAREIQKKLTEQFPAVPSYQQDLSRTHNNLAILFNQLRMLDEGRSEYARAREIHKKLADQFPTVPKYQEELAASHNNLGVLLKELGNSDEAVKEYLQARDITKKLVEQFPVVPTYQQQLAMFHNNLAKSLAALGKQVEAQSEYELARDAQKKLAEQYPAVPAYRQDLAKSHNSLAQLLNSLGERDEALAEYKRARDLRKELAEQFPVVPEYQQDLAKTHNGLGLFLKALGKLDDASTEFEQGVVVNKALTRQFPAILKYQVSLGAALCNYGDYLLRIGKTSDSLESFDNAIKTLTPVHQKSPREPNAREFLRNNHVGRAQAYDLLAKHADAVKDWDKAIELASTAELPIFRAARALSWVHAGSVTEAITEATELAASDKLSAMQAYNYACVFSVASGKDEANRDEYARRAVELLARSIAKGWTSFEKFHKDTDLDPLRDRGDFKKLLGEVDKKSPTASPTNP